MSSDGGNSAKGRAAEAFEDLHVFQRARELTIAVYALTKAGVFARDRSLVNQIRRACASIMSNIAEGSERGAKTEFIQYLYVAKGSCGEVRAQLLIAYDQGYISEADHTRLNGLARLTSGMISNFIAHLQKSSYQGEKFARPQRQAEAAHEEHRRALEAAVEVNIRSREEREKREREEREKAGLRNLEQHSRNQSGEW